MAKVILSGFMQSLSGKAGGTVYVDTKDGIVMRDRKKPTNPKTPGQTTARVNLSSAASLFKNMTPAQAQAWNDYAQTIAAPGPTPGKKKRISGITAFTSLTAKFFQFAPTGTPSMTPPTASFAGDSITVAADTDFGQLIYRASGANAAGVQTEMLAQHLTSRNRTPAHKGYRLKAFNGFAVGNESSSVTVASGWYVPAYRFVNSVTGQTSPLVVLPPIFVPSGP